MSLSNQLKDSYKFKINFRFLFSLSNQFLLLLPLSPGNREELTVSAAISLKNTFEDLGRHFEKSHPGIKVLFNFGASGDLVKSNRRPVLRSMYLRRPQRHG